MTNPPPKRVPIPRAKIGDVVVLNEFELYEDGESRDSVYAVTITGMEYLYREKPSTSWWCYFVDSRNTNRYLDHVTPGNMSDCFGDKDIVMNLSSGIDYQEDESKPMSLNEQARAMIENGTGVVYGKEECKHEWRKFISDAKMGIKRCKWCDEQMN